MSTCALAGVASCFNVHNTINRDGNEGPQVISHVGGIYLFVANDIS